VNEISIPTARGTESFDSFVTTNSGVINAFVEDYRCNYGSVRLHVRVDAIFTRGVGEGLLQRIPAFFLHLCSVYDIDCTQQLDLQSVARPRIGTLAAAALYWSVLPSLYFVFLSIDPCMALHIFPRPRG